MDRKRLIQTALGQEKPALVLKNAQVIDVFARTVYPADVAIQDGRIAGIGNYDGVENVDLGGRYLAPGFINAHCHVESSMVTPPAYCYEELRWGVTTLITDPHEITNVLGGEGVHYMLRASEGLPVNYYIELPSCVPATPFEHAGDIFTAEKMRPFLQEPRVLGLGEMMNYPGVSGCDPEVHAKLELFSGRVVDGHAPAIRGNGLQAYIAAGIHTDHESVSWADAKEKLRAGMAVLVRQGSACRDLTAILTGAIAEKVDTRRMAFCTDDKHLADIRREGTVRWNLRMAVELGLDPIQAVQMATINAAQIYGLQQLGGIAPGWRADLVVLDDLKDFTVSAVYKDGVLYQPQAEKPARSADLEGHALHSVNLPKLSEDLFTLPAREIHPVLGIQPGQIVTRKKETPDAEVTRRIANGELRKLAVIERHHATGHVGVGLIEGYGLTHGAVATTVAHDSHNLIVVGDNDADMLVAAREIERVQGGYTIVQDGKVLGTLPLPVAGLMSELPAEKFIPALEEMLMLAKKVGVASGIDPFITLSFMALPVIPEIRVTDLGVFDVTRFAFIE